MDGKWTLFDAAIVLSLCPHEFALEGANVAHLFVEPEITEGRVLSSRFGARGIAALSQPVARTCAVSGTLAGNNQSPGNAGVSAEDSPQERGA